MSTEEIISHNLRRAYKLNHSGLRALARYASHREKKLRDVCKERQFWKGDKYSRPANAGAIAALRVIEGSLGFDLLEFRSRVNQSLSDKASRVAMSRVSFHSIRAYKTNLPELSNSAAE